MEGREDVKQIQWVARLISRPLYAMMNRAGFRRPSLAILDKVYSDLSELRINADRSTAARKYLSEAQSARPKLRLQRTKGHIVAETFEILAWVLLQSDRKIFILLRNP